jgi:predicted short-subunit dehydrogenase-like oxidoreductase (DUF2520 family)
MTKKAVNNIVLIGSGNVATRLGIALTEAGYKISQVYSPRAKSAALLAKKLRAEAISDLKKLTKDGVVYIIAVKDDAIEGLAKKIKLKSAILVHTSGSVKMDVLKKSSHNHGVLYPLQTLSKDKKVDFRNIPLCIEASNKATELSLLYFAKSISGHVIKVNSSQRRTIHLAAVFACNFSNYLYSVSENILKKEKLSFDLLKPLIAETAAKVKTISPAKAQTGPAARGDKKTIEMHLKMLKDKKHKEIYKLMTKNIMKP